MNAPVHTTSAAALVTKMRAWLADKGQAFSCARGYAHAPMDSCEACLMQAAIRELEHRSDGVTP